MKKPERILEKFKCAELFEPYIKSKDEKQFVLKGTDNWVRVASGKTWEEVEIDLAEVLDKIKKSGRSMTEVMAVARNKYDRKKHYLEWDETFRKMTGIPKVPRCGVLYLVTGLMYADPVAFNQEQGVPDEVSLKDWLTEKHGKAAERLFFKMMCDEEENDSKVQ